MFETRTEPALDKHGNKIEGRVTIHFMSGPIKDHPGYAVTKTRTVIKTGPEPLNKREKRRQKTAEREHPGGHHFTCQCRRWPTYHFPSHANVTPEGYEKKQRVDSYECCLCGFHYDRQQIDDAVEKAKGEAKQA